MIWLKRIAPFVIIAILYFGNTYYQKITKEKQTSDERRIALITAQVWVASKNYRDNPGEFMKYRDSLLEKNNLSNELLKKFIESYSDKAENLGSMTVYIKSYVDSILQVEDSLRIIADSVAIADSLTVDTLETKK